MPIYEYLCEPCEQVFSELRPLSEHQAMARCPSCRTPAARILASAPRLNVMRASIRRAHETNERSAHAPRISSRGGHVCGADCGHHRSGGDTSPPAKQQAGKRPWMLGH